MRRWFWTAAVVAGLGLSHAHADYIVIRMNIGGRATDSAIASGAPAGTNPYGPPSFPGMPGGGGGKFGGGAGGAGMPGAMGPGMPGMQMQGRPGIPGAPGMPGMPGAMGPGMQRPGMPGMGGAGMPGGAGGKFGGGGAAAGGAGMPGAMGPGMPGMGQGMPGMGGMPGMPGMSGGGEDFDTFETIVIGVIELNDNKAHINESIAGLPPQWKHKWGQSAFYNDGSLIQSFHVTIETPKKLFAKKRKTTADSKTKTADLYLADAEWALNHGLLKECMETIVEAGKQPDPSPQAQRKLAAFAQVTAAFEKPVDGIESVNAWRGKLNDFQVIYSKEGHYAVFYRSPSQVVPDEAKRLAEALERHMAGYYLWFALHGKALPVPQDKLVAIQVENADSFKAQRAVLELPGISEGFYAPRDNVAVFSSRRLDDAYVTFSKLLQSEVRKGWNRDELLRGREIRQLKEAVKDSGVTRSEFLKRDYPRLQTLFLLDKALEEEAELAAVSHEGSRQLAGATDLLSRNVVLPEWVSFGFASLFETPKGPFTGANGTAQVAFWPSVGGANWAYLRQIKQWAAAKDEFTKLDPAPDALRRTITDTYFHRLRLPQNMEISPNLTKTEHDRRVKEIARAKEESFRAMAHAWALNFYLSKYKFDDYLAFLKALSNLPRDLELDDQTLLLTFARSFHLTNATGDGIDQSKFNALANDWIAKITQEETPGKEFKLDDPVRPRGGLAGPGMPGAPGRPGGGAAGGAPADQ